MTRIFLVLLLIASVLTSCTTDNQHTSTEPLQETSELEETGEPPLSIDDEIEIEELEKEEKILALEKEFSLEAPLDGVSTNFSTIEEEKAYVILDHRDSEEFNTTQELGVIDLNKGSYEPLHSIHKNYMVKSFYIKGDSLYYEAQNLEAMDDKNYVIVKVTGGEEEILSESFFDIYSTGHRLQKLKDKLYFIEVNDEGLPLMELEDEPKKVFMIEGVKGDQLTFGASFDELLIVSSFGNQSRVVAISPDGEETNQWIIEDDIVRAALIGKDLYYETPSRDGVLVEGSEVKEVDATLSSLGLEHVCPTKDGAFLMREISHAEKFYFFDAAKNETFERALDKPLKRVENIHSQAIFLDDDHLYLIKAYKGAPSEGDGWQISTLIIN